MFKVTIELPATITVPLGDTGKSTEVPVKQIAERPEMLRFAAIAGFMGALANISRGKDEEGKPLSDAVWATARQKKVDTWLQGDWAGKAGGGERATTALKEAFVDERKANTGATTAQIERSIKATVAEVFGKDEAATFGRFMDALAVQMARRNSGNSKLPADDDAVGTLRSKIEAKYRRLADEAAAKRAAAKEAIDVSDIDLGDLD